LDRAGQPRLFEEIDAVAQATAQRVPAHVCVFGEVNAAVFSAGGWMGIGATRRMVLGLPVIGGLSVSQLRDRGVDLSDVPPPTTPSSSGGR
jgi:hypothetical protein